MSNIIITMFYSFFIVTIFLASCLRSKVLNILILISMIHHYSLFITNCSHLSYLLPLLLLLRLFPVLVLVLVLVLSSSPSFSCCFISSPSLLSYPILLPLLFLFFFPFFFFLSCFIHIQIMM